MNWSLYGLFLVAGFAAAAAPGPSTFFAVSQALRLGPLAMLPTVAGLLGSSLTYALLVLFGVGSLLTAFPLAFEVIRWGGAAYLFWLAWKQWHSAAVLAPADDSAAAKRRTMREAYIVGMTNPSIALFYLFFIPQFVDPALPVFPQLAALVASQVLIKATVLAFCVGLAGYARNLLREQRHVVLMNRGAAALMALAGGFMVWSGLKSMVR